MPPLDPTTLATIVSARLHPAIGVARVGNAEEAWFFGPEVPEQPPLPPESARDDSGALKRQAARFRVFGYDVDGKVVAELTAHDAEVTWTAHLCNRKAAWYRFDAALDLPELPNQQVPLRNAGVADRASLVIDPGPRTVAGSDAAPVPFDTGAFRGTPVYLGELRTDGAGRLVVLGGRGHSASPSGAPIYVPGDQGQFNNADDWYDDTSDGPVSARVVVAGRELPVEPAWVVVGPPNYAPDVVGWRTMHDLQRDLAIEQGWLPFPDPVRFDEHIQPVLQRLAGLQWVNYGFGVTFGHGAPFDFEDPVLLGRLARAPSGGTDPWQELRRQVFHAIRPPGDAVAEDDPRPWPWLYGDRFGVSGVPGTGGNLAASATRDRLLRAWVEGDFVGGARDRAAVRRRLEDFPIAEQPAALDRASMDFCLADAFHPGCELTWPMRQPSLYDGPFRIRHRETGQPEPDRGRRAR